jgi:hypothetical protein
MAKGIRTAGSVRFINADLRFERGADAQVARGQLGGCLRATTLLLRMRRLKHMEVITLQNCKRCGKTWFPRTPGTPKICPTCKTTYWDTPKKERKAHENA